MERFTTLTGVAAPMNMINIDTDMVIPKQFLKTIKRTGLGKHLFSEMRYNEDDSENPDFVLNKPAYRNAQILIAGDNFGCGSSREHAPWAISDFGIKCVISESFADIFYNNCFKNGVLPLVLPAEQVREIMDKAENDPGIELNVDLVSQRVWDESEEISISFEIDAARKDALVNGLDDIGLTLRMESDIGDYESKHGL